MTDARDKWVPSVTWVTSTLRKMVCDSTRGVDTTDPRTGISTLVIDTGLVIGTLGVGDALWLALNIRVASVVEDTPTRCRSS